MSEEKPRMPSILEVPKTFGLDGDSDELYSPPPQHEATRRKIDLREPQTAYKKALLEQANQLAAETGVTLPEMPNYYYLAEYGEELIRESDTLIGELMQDGLEVTKAKKRAILTAHRNAVKIINERIKGESDPLTGLRNRAGFDRLVLHMVEDAGEANQPICILVGDVNGLKAINDTEGHTEGDKLISKTGNVLDSKHRDTDLFSMLEARYGGDEFRAVFPGTKKEGVQIWFEEGSKAFEESGVSIGLGVVEISPEEIRECSSKEELLSLIEKKCEIADAASYAAKDVAKRMSSGSGTKKSWLLTDDDESTKSQLQVMHDTRANKQESKVEPVATS